MIRNHFDYVPEVVGKKRSVFPYNQPHSASYEMGRLYPLDVIEVRPGSTFNLNIAGVLRSGTLIHPLMDDIIVDVAAFFVKNRISWTHWEQFLGSNDDVAFDQTQDYVKPYINYFGIKAPVSDPDDAYSPAFTASTGAFDNELRNYCNSLACHFGLPVMPDKQNLTETGEQYIFKFDALWVRGFMRIWNEFWRDENFMDPVLFSLSDTGMAGESMGPDGIHPMKLVDLTPGADKLSDNWQLGFCPKVCKLKDYFTSATQSPVRAGAVPAIPVDSSTADVLSASTLHDMGNTIKLSRYAAGTFTSPTGTFQAYQGSLESVTATTADGAKPVNASSLYVNLANTSSIAISKFRDAILLNRLYENRLRIGGRYPEILQGEFGVRKQIDDRAQLLIHKRFNIAVSEVVSTAQTDSGGTTVNAVGDLGGMSKTPIKDSLFTASFDEDGLIFITLCIRQRKHTYVQGWAKKFYRETWLDYYWPSLNGTSDVIIEKQELLASFDKIVGNANNKAVFGYQEYGADEKVQFARSVGMLNPQLLGAIKGWNMADVYESANGYPVLDANFLVETPDNLTRDLVIQDLDLSPQFIGDFLIYGTVRKVMPVYNIPGVGGVL